MNDLGEKTVLQKDRIKDLVDTLGADVYLSLLESFFGEEDWIMDIFSSDDLPRISAGAHKIKGTAVNLGLGSLAHQARSIEMAAKAGDSAEVRTLIETFRQIYKDTKATCEKGGWRA